MKCQNPFSGKYKKNSKNLSAAEFALSVIKVMFINTRLQVANKYSAISC